ncbi:MAG: GWxTD domain-containing protein [Ignavibacteriaceae bacterium]
MKLLNFILLLTFSFSILNAQVETVMPGKSPARAKFAEDFLIFSSDNKDETRLDIFIQIPYTEIQFVKNDQLFTASYTVTLSIFDEEKDKLIVEKLWNESIETKEFNQTISKNNFNLSLRSFQLKPGKYFIRSAVEDKESKQNFSNERLYEVRDLSGRPSLSDIMLISRLTVSGSTPEAEDDNSTRSNKILPNISKNVSAERDGIPFFFEIYSDSSGSFNIAYQIVDAKEEIIFSKDTVQQVDTGRTQIFYTIPKQEFGLGNYALKVMVKDDDDILASVSKPFVSRWIGVPAVIRDLDKAIDQLVYIASSSEINEIEDAGDQGEKVKRYMAFWKKKDPTPDTEENEIFNEYYRRVSLANENFSHYIEGWRTDRGMVLIILGAPNNIERHPFEYNSKPYEVWQYYELNREFTFLDETGFGDYRLVSPFYGDDYRYR